MALSPGIRLGPYEIVSALGAGGMGEVYKARDSRLDRTVAIKVLPAALAADAEFRDRFDREARAVSQLDHPHICALYDIGQDQDTSYLVMQYLEGETLDSRLKTGALPLEQALKIGVEIASALDAAHKLGIIHRDLKPGNIILTKSGAKLLDFGLAKTLPGVSSGSVSALQTTPAVGMTAQGTILGTFQYMSPEQIEGEPADARADIFAFGAVLHEMLTGRKAFTGKTQASLLGAILKDEPPPVSQVQATTPPALDHLVRTCLAKDPDARYQTAHDVWLQLRWIAEGGSAVGLPAPVAARRKSRERLAWVVAGVLGVMAVAAGAVTVRHLREQPEVRSPLQFTIAGEENGALVTPPDFTVSDDGRQIAFIATWQARPMLWVRPFDSLTARLLQGTDGASSPFWSPDGRQLGFFAAGNLKKIDATGSGLITLCQAPGLVSGGTWNPDNVIVFASAGRPGLQRVNAAGGVSARIGNPKSESSDRWPTFMPDGRHVLYLAITSPNQGEHRVVSLDSGETVSIAPTTDSNAFYASGHLVFVRGTTLMAQPFDPSALRLSGDPFQVADQVFVTGGGHAAASASTTGMLGYWRGTGMAISRLTWIDRAGHAERVVGEAGNYANFGLSPDGRRVAVVRTVGTPPNRDVWIVDMARDDTATRLTFDAGREGDPVWSADGSHVIFNSDRTGMWNTGYQRAVDGSGDDVPLVKMERLFDSPDWSHDGRNLVFTGSNGGSNDLFVLPLSGDRKPVPFVQTPFIEDSPAFSPDDKWVAYNSNASGRFEVYVRAFPGPGGQFQISRDGGWAPKWRGDGQEMFFLALDGTMMSATITPGKELQASVPRPLFPTQLLRGADRHTYDVTKDGKRFLVRVPDQKQITTPLTMVVSWPALAKK